MVAHAEVWIIGFFILIISIFLPFLHYLKCAKSSKKITFPDIMENMPDITILLPIKDESILIEKKLSEILNLDYPKSKLSLLVINSGSTDGSYEISKKFLNTNFNEISWKIENLKKPGKSYAVNMAIEMINTDIFIMMDAESQLNNNCLKKLVRWFSKPEVGGVCGRLETIKSDPEYQYRSRFNILRVGESVQDSTPIFEGSICAFRKSYLMSKKIDSNINADDTQLAMLIRGNNFKAIMDPEVSFSEPFDIDYSPSRARKIRRAQGLTRALWKYRNLNYSKGYSYSLIYISQFYFYIIFPWLFLFSTSLISLSIIYQIVFTNLAKWTISNYIYLLPSIFIFFKTPRNLFGGCIILLQSHLLLLFGKKLNIWNTDSEMRKSIKSKLSDKSNQ
tara:strand:- start:14340 stop:15515 length:1176 start_codon:yes stop_codon:yes gene_type:complete